MARTSVIANVLLSAGALLAFLALTPYASSSVGSPLIYFALFSLQIPAVYAVAPLEAVADAVSPEVRG